MSEPGSARVAGEANTIAARALVGALVANGLREAVLAPGSRSGPIAMAVAERSEIRTYVITDERSAAFFALGLARYREAPPLLVCTSGTAAANFAPAVAEAAIAEVPLLVITADRPPEARGFGAPQTIRQPDLFARHVRLGLDAAVPSSDGPPAAYYRALAAKALAATLAASRGPVHLNLPFREPLTTAVAAPGTGRETDAAVITTLAELRIPPSRRDAIAARLAAAGKGALVCGPTSRPHTLPLALVELANRLRWPVLADPLSGVRTRGDVIATLIEPHDLVLRSAAARAALRPDVVLRFGSLPTSKTLRETLAGWDAEQIVVTSSEEWPDPDWRATEVVICDPRLAAVDLAAALPADVAGTGASADYVAAWRDLAGTAAAAAAQALESPAFAVEAGVARELCAALPGNAILVVGNSMPVRDVDAFCTSLPADLSLLGNRGANGIDGVLSTAFGVAAASGRRTAVLLGDLSFLHDAAALRLAAEHDAPLLVVVVNNDGGGIFHSLPWSDTGATFERYFATPHGLEISSVIAPSVAETVRIRRPGDLAALVADWSRRPRLVVAEARFERRDAHAARNASIERVRAAVDARARTMP